MLLYNLISIGTESKREQAWVSELPVTLLAVGPHISSLNAKHMLMCGWESRESRRGYPCLNMKTPSLSICKSI